ncbi:39S ribosomal protein L11, mitochondrial isoform X4 [Hemicordylus capensis]|uniref:39S ribosomal protein L11, mitochondrial isoform X4 n=1 Tax=Hemicordylus capensis TaxID=884348 RepID=UPI0023029257|nr:39S ribosomal protein L11, mitochondrial isoform X4 [Hemicordylus capensis]
MVTPDPARWLRPGRPPKRGFEPVGGGMNLSQEESQIYQSQHCHVEDLPSSQSGAKGGSRKCDPDDHSRRAGCSRTPLGACPWAERHPHRTVLQGLQRADQGHQEWGPVAHPHHCTGHEVAGMVTLKHLYEIALVKSQDPSFVLNDLPLEKVIRSLMGSAKSLGIKVVKDLSAEEYATFLKQREEALAAEAEAKALELQEAGNK